MSRIVEDAAICDIVEIDVVCTNIASDIEFIKNAVTEVSHSVFGKANFTNIKTMAKNIQRSISGVEITDIIDDTLYIKLEDGTELEAVRGEDTVKIKRSHEKRVFGYIIDYLSYPFVIYHDGIKVNLLPYEALKEKIRETYRHAFSNDEAFRYQLTHNFLMPDLIAALSGKPCHYDAAFSMYGSASLNYIYITMAFLGTRFPKEWATDGAPVEMLTDYKYGFREI